MNQTKGYGFEASNIFSFHRTMVKLSPNNGTGGEKKDVQEMPGWVVLLFYKHAQGWYPSLTGQPWEKNGEWITILPWLSAMIRRKTVVKRNRKRGPVPLQDRWIQPHAQKAKPMSMLCYGIKDSDHQKQTSYFTLISLCPKMETFHGFQFFRLL